VVKIVCASFERMPALASCRAASQSPRVIARTKSRDCGEAAGAATAQAGNIAAARTQAVPMRAELTVTV